MKSSNEALQNPRVIIIQKLYSYHFNRETEITYPKHRYKKFIKDVVKGTIERKELIQDLINKELKEDINLNKTELIIKLMMEAAIYEFMYMHYHHFYEMYNKEKYMPDYYLVNKKSKEFNNPKVKYDYLNSDRVLLKYMNEKEKVNYNIKKYINLFLDQNLK